ncbi:sugar ABC transporter substrate-binding protein [Actinomadura syzygii]|uniref:Sugar ABC transporter substrate-binding protein n=1 Tax=Actinomadura syzygii TaxID=1427538 RepID=A0A5D0UBJ1_9ACTN|nr:hypothetical protein [Actinomadura syzygii]TYC15911.1 hypothetical protein FXF65_11260 [Actinomadura syzygii]
MATSSGGPASEAGKKAAAALAARSKPLSAAPELGQPFDVRALKGKTVYYIPIALKVGHFPIIVTNLTSALGKAGVSVRTCDGQGNPSGISACLDQAAAAGPGAIITDYIPYQMVPTAFERVKAKGIPLLIAGANAPAGTAQTPKFAFGNADSQGFPLMSGLTDAVIADSDGKANLLFLEVTDSESTTSAGEHALAQLKQNCAGCTVTVKKINLSQMKNVGSLVSSALLTDPKIKYVVPQYDTYLAAVIGGLQSSGKAAAVKIATTGNTLAAVQQVKTNPRLIAVVGVNSPYLAWTEADSALRMMAGQTPPAAYPAIPRTFTKDNVSGLTFDPAHEASGAWYGDPALIQDAFTKLWTTR